MDSILKVQGLTKVFGYNTGAAVKMLQSGSDKNEIFKQLGVTVGADNVSFDVKPGGIFSIIGLSGSGKSTVVRCLNMLCRPTSGHIFFRGRDIAAFKQRELIEYRRKNVSMVFQHFGLLTHKNVCENVAFGLEVRGIGKKERLQKALDMIELVGLGGWENHSINDLSGGMKQRVGIARALTNDPDVLLMDEPFSALDPIVRRDMQFELLNIQKKVKKTIVFITHDIDEAFKLGETVAVMKDGQIVQTGTPEEILTSPADCYVENFVRDINRTKVLSAAKVMQLPTAFVRPGDGPNIALKVMRENGVSSVYVVGREMELIGLLRLDDALKIRSGELTMEEAIVHDIPVTCEQTLLSDLMPIAAKAQYPIAVVGGENQLKGIVTKAAVLSSLVI